MTLPRLTVSLAAQRLTWADGVRQQSWPVSTATVGADERNGSGGTPRGRHRVRARIGDGADSHAVFIGRRPTGEIWTPELAATAPHRDWILGRILWLCGCEPGRNRFGAVDTMRRYIYIHGTPPDQPLGVPGSHGCIRMACDDVVTLFDCTPAGSEVWIDD
ncbi:L,D-transpeptidase [Algiphilus sp. NNCM1]|uniref:L,D-transpeptidase n=1 Tax=Algiphilus sp. TaxID=1872431 RepID=UPI001CA662E7|nr:L,D-transpeptidase [Algiphilus sp.]MBY8966768.1 L,D-transpeptidase [Algiphilus acroporae]MCI5063874.1 L,D-transpeptidase [Algiphilus sp.]MCI5102142.1 L,D-transpeptidase [Algiphilus sp.]